MMIKHPIEADLVEIELDDFFGGVEVGAIPRETGIQTMRKIDLDVSRAVTAGKNFKRDNTSVTNHYGEMKRDGILSVSVRLHNTFIFDHNYRDKSLTLNHGGWLTDVTYNRLQACIDTVDGVKLTRDVKGFYAITATDIYKLPCTIKLS